MRWRHHPRPPPAPCTPCAGTDTLFHRAMIAVTTSIDRKVSIIMTDIAELQTAAAQIVTDITEAVTALDDLAAKVGAGETVAQADVDAITATLRGASASLDAAVATDDPTPAPPPA